MMESDRPDSGPAANEPMTFDEGVSALESVLDAPPAPTGTGKEPTQQEAKAQTEPASDDVSEVETEAPTVDDPDPAEEGEDESSEETQDETEEAGSPELTDETEIDLGDTRATLKDLKDAFKRVRGMQQSFTKNSQELAERRKTLETQEQKVLEHAQQLAQWRETVAQFAQNYLPQAPEPPQVSHNEDPLAWSEFLIAERNYRQQLEHFQAIQQQTEAERQREAQRQEQATRQIIAENREKLLSRRPELRDPEVAKRASTEMLETLTKEYGASADIVRTINDPIAIEVILDAIAYRKLKAKAPEAKKAVAAKPQMVKPLPAGKRASPDAQASKAKVERLKNLRQSGSFEAAVASLLDSDL